jgi:hypothetical protein
MRYPFSFGSGHKLIPAHYETWAYSIKADALVCPVLSNRVLNDASRRMQRSAYRDQMHRSNCLFDKR